MSNFKFLYKLVEGFFLISILMSCESRFPSVNTIDVINITANSAQAGGIVSDEGSGTVIARGLVWSMNYVPVLESHDGTPITNVTDKSTWTALDSPAFCWYNNLIENKNLAGAHYNWYAVETSRLCPTGWHVPSDNEWTILTDYLGGLEIAGAKMKETGYTHWEEPNVGATNSSGFTALPASQRRGIEGTFTGLGLYDSWWSSTEYNIYKSWYRSVDTINAEVWQSSGALKQTGTSIRCIKD